MRAAGLFSALVGLVASCFLAVSLWRVPHTMAAVLSPQEVAAWKHHWYVASFLYLAASLAVLAGGILMALRTPAGIALVGSAALVIAASPWVFAALGYSRFPWEQASLIQSAVGVLTGVLFLAWFRALSVGRT